MFLNIVKLILSIILFLYVIAIAYFLFFHSKEKRFSLAEHNQGLFLSQTLFDILIFQHPDYSNAYFEKSVAYNKRGDYAEGFKLLNKAVEIDPKSHLGYRGWLRLVKLKDYEGCISDLRKLDSLTPNYVDAAWGENIHYLIGLSYMGLNNYELALTEFDKYLISEKDSSWINPHMFLYKAYILKELENVQSAIDNLNSCIKYNHNSPEAYYYKGIIYKDLKKVDSANIFLKKSLQLYKEGYKNKDIYNEVPNELYLNDIESQITN